MFRIKFWGVRGSVATAGVENARVGGNTSCVEVRCGDVRIALDAGTGLRGLGAEMAAAGARDRAALHVVLSHYHWDHIQGFPFFGPAYVDGNVIDVHGPVTDGTGAAGVRAALESQMRSPHFPVDLSAMCAEILFHGVAAGATSEIAPGVVLRSAAARHPDGCLAYRIDHAGRALVYATDTEHDPSGEVDPVLLDLAQGADLLVYDAQYTEAEWAGKRGWGHSTAEAGARLADAAGVGRLFLFHHDPAHDDWAIARIEAAARARRAGVLAAREGIVVDLESVAAQEAHVAA